MSTHALGSAGRIAVAAAFTLLAGCGSSDSAKSSQTTAAEQPQATDAATDATNAPANGAANAGAVKLPVQSATYGTGRVHVDFGGDTGGSVEVDGSGIVTGGFANLGFSDDTRSLSVVFVFGGDQDSVATFTYDGITSGGTFGKECSINFTKADSTALEATFSCTKMTGVSVTSTDVKSVDAKGSFRMATA